MSGALGIRRLSVEISGSPVLTDVTISGSALVAHAPERVPDVYAGSPVLAALSLLPEGGELVVRGKLAIGSWEERVRVPPTQAGNGNPALAALYAREKVADLEIRGVCGTDCDREIETLGITYQIATRLTSWVAVDERVRARGSARHEAIPQELPYGTTAAAFGLRGGGIVRELMPMMLGSAGVAPAQMVAHASTFAAPRGAYSKGRSRAWLFVLLLIAALIAALVWWLL